MTPAQTRAFDHPCLTPDETIVGTFSSFEPCAGGFWGQVVTICIEEGGDTYWFATLKFYEKSQNCPGGPLPITEWSGDKLREGRGRMNDLLSGVGDIDRQVVGSSELSLFQQRPVTSEELSELTKRETSK